MILTNPPRDLLAVPVPLVAEAVADDRLGHRGAGDDLAGGALDLVHHLALGETLGDPLLERVLVWHHASRRHDMLPVDTPRCHLYVPSHVA